MTEVADQPRPLQPGDVAPDFALPAVSHDGVVSLSDYTGRKPLFLALLRGLYCPFCRRHLARLGPSVRHLRDNGVESLAVVATPASRARLYHRMRPTEVPLAADPELSTHRAYRVPNLGPMTEQVATYAATQWAAMATERTNQEVAPPDAKNVLNRLDGFDPTETDHHEEQRHGVQLVGRFLLDAAGRVQWTSIENQVGDWPTDEEILSVARSLAC